MGSPSEHVVVEELNAAFRALSDEIGKVIVGQEEVVEQLLIALFAAGTACSSACRGWPRRCSSARCRRSCDLSFKRIQFTPDLMPADITGTDILAGRSRHRPAAASFSCAGRSSPT